MNNNSFPHEKGPHPPYRSSLLHGGRAAERRCPILHENVFPVPPQVELMYVKGLRYLQNAQKTDGTYDGTYGQEPGIIGFCLMSVLAHGDDPNTGPYATMVRRCVNYILSKQNRGSGYIGDSMYNHGFATLALAEAYGMVRTTA